MDTSTAPSTLPCSQFCAQVRARMAQLGMRWTPGMAALLRVLEKGGFALTHEQIYFELAQGSLPSTASGINRVTVYRLLERLETLGIVAKTIGSDRLSRFRLKNTGTTAVSNQPTPSVNPSKPGKHGAAAAASGAASGGVSAAASQGYFECVHCHTVETLGLASLPMNIRKWLDHAAPNGQAVTEMMLRGTCGECAVPKTNPVRK